jgi:hypothetical protein
MDICPETPTLFYQAYISVALHEDMSAFITGGDAKSFASVYFDSRGGINITRTPTVLNVMRSLPVFLFTFCLMTYGF